MKPVLRLLLLLPFLSGCGPSPQVLYTDYLAGRDFKNEKYEEALTRYYGLLEADRRRPGTHSNIGVLLDMIQKNEDAGKSLQHALGLAVESGDREAQFIIQYNLGVHNSTLKKPEEALAHYQAALEIVPDSVQVKTNIELLLQQQRNQQKQGQDGDQKPDQKQDQKPDPKDGQGKSDPKDGQDKDQKDKDNGEDQKDRDQQKDDRGDKKEDQKKQSSPKYQPRPFKGDQLSEGDVKKILGELKNQEQKIRSHFDKKEKGKSKGNDKDW